MKDKLLFFCSTNNFKQITRRATIESISELITPACTVMCVYSFWKRSQINNVSDKIKVCSFYNFFPLTLLKKIWILNFINFYINKLFFLENLLDFEFVCFTTTNESFLIDFFKKRKRIFILSDPYHKMRLDKKSEEILLKSADFVFTTAKELRDSYINKYFGRIRGKVIYWPNCADLAIWNFHSLAMLGNKEINTNSKFKIGFAGNLMEATDVQLLHDVISGLPMFDFILAGKVDYLRDSEEDALLSKIIKFPNVDYRGLIPFEQLPKEILEWDICIMIDKIDEVSSYHHHNKYYQYLALGKPVIYQKNHNDYEPFKYAYGVIGAKEFIEKIIEVNHVIALDKDVVIKECLKYVEKHSSKVRANQFLKELGIKSITEITDKLS